MTDSEKLDLLLKKISVIDGRLDSMDGRFDAMDKRLDSLDKKQDITDTKINTIDKRLQTVEKNVTGIQLTVENEIRKNIAIVAEGHLDLSRKLDRALILTYDAEREVLAVRVNILENECRMMKEQLAAM